MKTYCVLGTPNVLKFLQSLPISQCNKACKLKTFKNNNHGYYCIYTLF